MKDHLLFIIDYSLNAVSNDNENIETNKFKNKKSEEKEENKNKKEKVEEQKKENIEDKKEKEENSGNKNDKKLINEELNENKFYGLNLLLSYLAEEKYKKYSMTNEQKIELINTTIDGIIKIIEKSEEKDLIIKNILLKVKSYIINSKDIIQHLILYEKIMENKNTNKHLNSILKDYSQIDELLSDLMKDMNRYLSLTNENNNGKDDDIHKEKNKIYEGLFDNELNIKLRLKKISLLMIV